MTSARQIRSSEVMIETLKHAPRLSDEEIDEQLKRILRKLPACLRVSDAKLRGGRHVLRRDALAVERVRRYFLCPPPARLEGIPFGWVLLPCRQRFCEDCNERRARKIAERMIAETSGYKFPRAVLVTAPSRTLFDLSAALDSFRKNLTKLRRRRWFARQCPAGVLALECPTTSNGARWALHGHGVADVHGDFVERAAFEGRVAREWRELTGQGGAVFELEQLHDARSLLSYGMKVGNEKSWAPGPSTLTARTRAHLDAALHGRRLLITWSRKVETQ